MTPKQKQAMNLLISGYTQKEIASKMNITSRTVERHLSNARKKLNARTLCQAAVKYAA